MILRNVAVRHGRRTLATPMSRCLLRQLSTESATPALDNKSQLPVSALSTGQSAIPEEKRLSNPKKTPRSTQSDTPSLGTDSAHQHKGVAWTTPHPTVNSATPVSPAQQYAEFKRIQKNTRSLGSRLEKRYIPTELVTNPPGPEDVTLELLMASQTHIGHSTSLWNPANSRYMHGVRQGIHIISLETTAAHLRRAARVVEEVSYNGGLILFVGNRKGQMEIVTKAAEMAGACHLFTRWTPGGITNRDAILQFQSVKVVNHLDEELEGFQKFKGETRPLMPDLVVCLNPLENFVLLAECGHKSIPTIGVIDTNADPSWVTYTIPANDDSLRAMAVVAGVLGRAGERGYKRRLQDAKNGTVTWQNPPEITRFMQREIQAAFEERKEVMGKLQTNVEGFTEEEKELLRSQLKAKDLDVTEDEMLDLMGEAALGEAKEAVLKTEGLNSSLSSTLAHIEDQMTTLGAQAEVIESQIKSSLQSDEAKSSLTSTLTHIEEQLASLKAEAQAAEVVVKASVKTSKPVSTLGPSLSHIEEQLASLKAQAQAVEKAVKGAQKK